MVLSAARQHTVATLMAPMIDTLYGKENAQMKIVSSEELEAIVSLSQQKKYGRN